MRVLSIVHEPTSTGGGGLFEDLVEERGGRLEQVSIAHDASGLDHTKGICCTVEEPNGYLHRIMCVFDGDFNTVIHEAVHMAGLTLQHVGVKFGPNNDEPLAYLAAWIAERFVFEMADDLKVIHSRLTSEG